jgi:hypothetical protein
MVASGRTIKHSALKTSRFHLDTMVAMFAARTMASMAPYQIIIKKKYHYGTWYVPWYQWYSSTCFY